MGKNDNIIILCSFIDNLLINKGMCANASFYEVNISDIVQFIGVAITGIAVIIAVRTLRSMNKQRKEAIKPCLVPSDLLIQFFRTFSVDTVPFHINKTTSFEVSNIGEGAAKIIELFFIIDYSKIIEEIRGLDTNKDIDISEHGRYTRISAEKLNFYLEFDSTETFHQSSSVVKGDNNTIFYLPTSIFLLYGFIMHLKFKSIKDNAASISRIGKHLPPFYVFIGFHDIANNKLVMEYTTEFDLQLWYDYQDLSVNDLVGVLTIRFKEKIN